MTDVNPIPGLFSQLLPMLAQRAVLITVSQVDEGRIQVNVVPRQLKEGENQALTTPLCLTGSAAELDAELVTHLSTFVAAQTGFNSNLHAIEKELAEAEQNAREEAKRKQQKPARNLGQKTSTEPTTNAQITQVAPPAAQTLDLFAETAETGGSTCP